MTFEESYAEYKNWLLGQARYWQHKYPYFGEEEIDQLVLLGFWKAFKAHKDNPSATLKTHAGVVIKGTIMDEIRSICGRYDGGQNRQEYLTVKMAPFDIIEIAGTVDSDEEDLLSVLSAKAPLTKGEKDTLHMIRIGMSWTEMGCRVGSSPSLHQMRYGKILEKMQKASRWHAQ